MAQPEIGGIGKGKAVMIFGSTGEKWIAALIDLAGHLKVDVITVPLPDDAATQTTLALILAELDVALSTRAKESGGNLAAILAKMLPHFTKTDGEYYVSNPTAHATTERWRYTVPGTKRAIITHLYLQTGFTPAAMDVSVNIDAYLKAGTVHTKLAALVSNTTGFQFYQAGEEIHLEAGDYVYLETYSGTANAIYMGGSCALVEYDHT